MSCINQEKKQNDSSPQKEENNTEYAIDFNLINYLNQANKKTIELATISFSQIKDQKILQLVSKIKEDHQNINLELKKLTEKNLIIIPQIVYHLDISPDSIRENNPNFYLLSLLEDQIKNQITVFDSIEKTTQNIDFKTFAIKSKKTLQNNNDALQTYSTPYYEQSLQLGLR